jgi:Lysylphosphatidylglycerol synthase TM region
VQAEPLTVGFGSCWFLQAPRVVLNGLVHLASSRSGKQVLTAGSGLLALALTILAGRHLAATSWPLSHGHPGLLAAVALLSVCGYALKAYGWQRLFATDERPDSLALAAAGGAASITGMALPGRFDDAVRIAIVRRYPGCPAGVRTLCLSLFMLGLIDTAALTPLAAVAAALAGGASGVRAGLVLVAAAGVAATALVIALPRLAGSRRLLRLRLGRWLSPRTTPLRDASQAWALVSACWLVRALQVFLLLGALGIRFSFPLALLFLCAGAAAAALPIGPGAAATQVGAGAAVLITSGVATSQAVGVAIAGQALGVLSGGSILLFAALRRGGLWRGALRLHPLTEREAVVVKLG